MGFAIVFSGQGMQHAGMLPWLAEDASVAETRCALGVGDWRAALDDPVWTSRNANAQTLLTGLNIAAWTQLSASLESPAAVAGYSVGELAGFAAAGVFDARTALVLAGTRAQVMDRCADTTPAGLLAVSGMAPAQVARLCAESGCAIAIENGDRAAVLGGAWGALHAAEKAAYAAGASTTRLKVNVASHTPWMQAAADAFALALSALPLQAPRVPLFANTGDRISSGRQAASALTRQMAQTVRWSTCMDHIHMRRVGCVLEVGPGAGLARMWNQRFPDVPARSVDEFRSQSAIVDWVKRHGSE